MRYITVVENVARYSLVILLVLNFSGSVFISIINPETYFFGEKIGGTTAIICLLIEGIAGTLIAYLLIKKKSEGEILSASYFGYFFIETLITNIFFGIGLLFSPLFTLGLLLSMVILLILIIRKKIKKIIYEKNVKNSLIL